MRKILEEGLTKLKIDYSNGQIEQLMDYSSLLKEWNEKVNLTAITEDRDIAVKHFLDCASCLSVYNIYGNVIDVGTGAGFPGLVLKILKPDINLYLLDSLNKRLVFLKEVTNKLGITGTELIHMRAEEGGRDKKLRENFDFAVSRAVANLSTLSEYCTPFIKNGGEFLALKGPDAEREIKEADGAIGKLSCKIEEVKKVEIPFENMNHCIVRIKKMGQTSAAYPRKAPKPSKEPLK